MRLLLIEDDPLIGEGLVMAFHQQGDEVDWLADGQQALEQVCQQAYDVMILDLGLPGMDGTTLLSHFRRHGGDTPCLILTARDTLADKIKGLDLGADDYLTKPFELDELKARIRAIARRSSDNADNIFSLGEIELDTASRQLRYQGEDHALSRREYDLLYELLLHAGRIMTREHLEQLLYGMEGYVGSNAIEVHIHNLRKKTSADTIRTVRGVGYTIPQNPAEHGSKA